MAIMLPQFEDTFCGILTVCSRVQGEAEDLPSLPSEAIDKTAGYGPAARKSLIRLMWDPSAQPCHLHVDVARRSIFGKKAPATNEKLLSVRKLLARFEGTPVKAWIRGQCRVPLTSLPPAGGIIFAGPNGIKIKANKGDVELTGAQLTFRQAEIGLIRWELIRDSVFLDLEATRDLVLHKEFLVEAFRLINNALAGYVLGTASDEKTTL